MLLRPAERLRRSSPVLLVATVALLGGCGANGAARRPARPAASARAAISSVDVEAPRGIHKIRHVIVIMQENRSFDSYFGTYPGADGIPMRDGVPTVCVPDPASNTCVRPYHDPTHVNAGGPHGTPAAAADIDGGRMDGFIAQQQLGRRTSCTNVN
jgi:phospholipase C